MMTIKHKDKHNKRSIFRVIGSVIAAAVGIQSETNRKRDFQEGASPTAYVVVGLIATVVIVFAVIILVKLVVNGISAT